MTDELAFGGLLQFATSSSDDTSASVTRLGPVGMYVFNLENYEDVLPYVMGSLGISTWTSKHEWYNPLTSRYETISDSDSDVYITIGAGALFLVAENWAVDGGLALTVDGDHTTISLAGGIAVLFGPE
jgi:opacity protein-like surface antigen